MYPSIAGVCTPPRIYPHPEFTLTLGKGGSLPSAQCPSAPQCVPSVLIKLHQRPLYLDLSRTSPNFTPRRRSASLGRDGRPGHGRHAALHRVAHVRSASSCDHTGRTATAWHPSTDSVWHPLTASVYVTWSLPRMPQVCAVELCGWAPVQLWILVAWTGSLPPLPREQMTAAQRAASTLTRRSTQSSWTTRQVVARVQLHRAHRQRQHPLLTVADGMTGLHRESERGGSRR